MVITRGGRGHRITNGGLQPGCEDFEATDGLKRMTDPIRFLNGMIPICTLGGGSR
jgi:hypothetical protein